MERVGKGWCTWEGGDGRLERGGRSERRSLAHRSACLAELGLELAEGGGVDCREPSSEGRFARVMGWTCDGRMHRLIGYCQRGLGRGAMGVDRHGWVDTLWKCGGRSRAREIGNIEAMYSAYTTRLSGRT